MKEIWKDIKGYNGDYQISNFGRVMSFKNGRKRMLKNSFRDKNYYNISLWLNNKKSEYRIHNLVWSHFGDEESNGHEKQVDHIDRNKLNNRIDNLRISNNAQNNINRTGYNKTSKYKGVCWFKRNSKWRAYIGGKHIGLFDTEKEAAIAYNTMATKIYGEFAYLNLF